MVFETTLIQTTLDDIYHLEQQVGEGAMGIVYRATDLQRRESVAVKVMKSAAASDERLRRLFRREARAMARLNHPGIIEVFGYGVADGDRPYLAMEWAPGASLLTLPAPDDLETVVTLLDRVLEALCHAHARGVIHRDLKPANILVPGSSNNAAQEAARAIRRGAVKLVDFGIARIFDDLRTHAASPRKFADVARQGLNTETRPHEVRLEGTPRYMAPELYKGREGLIAPSNDIYAVGVLLFELLTGKPLFEEADNEFMLMTLQLQGDLPTCIPRPCLGVRSPPTSLLAAMLAPDPMERIGHAALVRRELHRWFDRQKTSVHAHRQANPATRAAPAKPWSTDDPLQETRTAPSQATASSDPELNLLAWRPMPVLGRAREQARLWQMAEHTASRQRASVLFLEGEPGVGKTHLVRWLAESASEIFLTQPMWCGLSAVSTLDAIRHVMERYFQVTGLDRTYTLKRLTRKLQQQQVPEHILQQDESLLLEFLRPSNTSPDADDSLDTSTLTSNLMAMLFDVGEELSALIFRVLRRASQHCPVMVIFDGLESHNADGVLRLLEYVIRQERTQPFPILFVVTAVHGVLEQLNGPASDALGFLEAADVMDRIDLRPLDEADLMSLLGRFQSFTEETRTQILDRAQGNPLYAVELAAHALRNPGTQGMPESISDLWRRRVALIAVRSEIGDIALRILELAAILGAPLWLDLLNTAWNAPALAHMRNRSGAILRAWELWIEHGVLVEEQGGRVEFRHALLRETLLSDMANAPRKVQLHDAAAWARRQLDLVRTPQNWLRLSEHLLYAGRTEEAWTFAHSAAQRLLTQAELRDASMAWTLCEQILDAQNIDEFDLRRSVVEAGCAQLAWKLGDPEEVHRRACLLCDRGRKSGQLSQLALGELFLAELALYDAAPQAAEELYDRALSRFETCAEPRGQVEALIGMTRLALRGGRSEVAHRHLARAQRLLEGREDLISLGRLALLQGQAFCMQGSLGQAEEIFGQARSHFERVGDRLGVARALSELGQIAQARGDIHGAEGMFRSYLEQAEALGDIPSAAQARANLGHARLLLGQTESAVALLEQSCATIADLNDQSSLAIVQTILVLALAHQGKWARSHRLLSKSLNILSRLKIYDLDVAESLESLVMMPQAEAQLGETLDLAVGEAASQWRNLGYLDRAGLVVRRAARGRS